MANTVASIETEFRAGNGKVITARVQTPAGTLLTQAALAASGIRITAERDGHTITGSTILSTSTVYDTIQGSSLSDSRWTKDTTGYNFRHEVPASYFPAAGYYRVNVDFDFASGEDASAEWYGACTTRVTT